MLVSLFAMHLTTLPATSKQTFGYQRAEILGALASVLMIWLLVGILGFEAVLRLIDDANHRGDGVDGFIMTIIGVCGFGVNVIDALILRWGNAPHWVPPSYYDPVQRGSHLVVLAERCRHSHVERSCAWERKIGLFHP
jgi:Co/Zn/Cd efflux system component